MLSLSGLFDLFFIECILVLPFIQKYIYEILKNDILNMQETLFLLQSVPHNIGSCYSFKLRFPGLTRKFVKKESFKKNCNC